MGDAARWEFPLSPTGHCGTLVVNALEPEWEARFEPKSYGFRPGRGCHDAIVAIHTTVSRTDAQRVWILDAD